MSRSTREPTLRTAASLGSVAAWGLATILIVALSRPAGAEIIVRKDGREIEGHITQEDDEIVTIQTTFGTFRIRRDQIKEIKGRRVISPAEREGIEAMDLRDYDRALAKFKEALKETTDPADRQSLQQSIAQAQKRIQEREEKQFRDQLKTARDLIAEKRFANALIELETLLRKNAERPDPEPGARIINREIGQLYMAEAKYYKDQINYTEAANSYRKAIELLPEDPEPYLQMAKLLQDRGSKGEEIIDYYVKGIERARRTRGEQELLEEYYQLGRTYLRPVAGREAEQGNLVEGIKSLLIVMRHGGEQYPFAANLLEEGFVKLNKTDYDMDAMVKMLQSTLEINPHAHRVRSILAEVYSKKKRADRVVEELKFIVDDATSRGEPLPEEVYYRLGLAYLAMPKPDYDAALEAFENEVRQNQLNYMALIKAAEVHTLLGTYDDALIHCNKAIALRRERPEAYWAAGQAHMNRNSPGDTQEATRYLRTALNLKSDFHKARIRLAEIEILRQRNSDTPDYQAAVELLLKAYQGIEDIEEAARTDEDRRVKGEAILWLAEIDADRKDFREALQKVQQALKEYPNLPQAHRLRGQLEQTLENYGEAKKAYLRAVELAPGDVDTYRSLGILCQNFIKDNIEAIKYYRLYLANGGTERETVNRWIAECEAAEAASGVSPDRPAETPQSGDATSTAPAASANTPAADNASTQPAASGPTP